MLNRLSLNRIGLNRIGLNRIGKPSGGSSDRPYIDPKVLDSLCGVWIMDQNTNESESRNIIKNKIADRGGDLELLNFGYKLNSGYGKYELDFNEFTTNTNINTVLIEKNKDTFYAETLVNNSTFLIYKTIQANNTLTDTPSFKAKVEINKGTTLQYRYINSDGVQSFFNITEEGEHEFPISYNNRYVNSAGVASNGFVLDGKNTCRITQIPHFQGALVTDGKDDMIVSQKSFIDIVGSDNQPYTIVSMVSFIDNLNTYFNSAVGTSYMTINNIDSSAKDKTGIFGYSTTNVINTPSVINNILGDKNDYHARPETAGNLIGRKFFIQGYLRDGIPTRVSSVAVYWTFISNKVLTIDEINQIIAYFKLDKYVTPQVIYDVKRQGLTNDTPDSDWYLKDFSGNGHDMQLYNYAKKLDSGIGKYVEDFTTWRKYNNVVVTKDKITVTDKFNQDWLTYKYSKSSSGISPMRIKITGIPINARIEYRYAKTSSDTALSSFDILEDGVYDIPESFIINNEYSVGFKLSVGDWTHIEITQIPDYEGALVSDGKDDYGKVEGLPILKDYTVVSKYSRFESTPSYLLSKAAQGNDGAFIFNDMSSSYSFATSSPIDTHTLFSTVLRYQSKYINQGRSINAGSGIDTDSLWLSIIRNNDNRLFAGAFYSMLLFPYSLSEFLLERQLKKYKLGTLYPDMVEFRPIVKSNVGYKYIKYAKGNNAVDAINPGDYIDTHELYIYITPNGKTDIVSEVKVNGVSFTGVKQSDGVYRFYGNIDKSPQKIDITIDEYIRFEDINLTSCYPFIPILEGYTYGDKLKVGTEVNYVKFSNLLPNVYGRRGEMQLNGVNIGNNTLITVSKSMVFSINKAWLLDTTEPHAIYSPQKLNIPNSSLKILGYVPDLTGKGNHGKLNNFAYTEDSGVAADGSIKFDGTDDHITIPTLAHGGKCVMMKVNWSNGGMLYDQRLNSSIYTFGILTGEATLAYNARNNGSTYIDGILNTSIIPSDLVGITHNITAVNDAAIDNNTVSPRLGVSVSNATFSNQALYEFMLFPEIPSEDEIKELNDIIGIEGGYVESPNYYWDAYGKKNTDTDRNLIADQVSKDVANALEVKNVAYNSESGYTDDNGLLLDGVEDHAVNTVIPAVTDFTVIAKRISQASTNDTMFITKGQDGVVANSALGLEYRNINGEYVYSFGTSTNVESIPDLITYCTPTNYNGKVLTRGNVQDTNGIQIGKFDIKYWKGVFYKLMFYTKTIDQLSINMLKNLFERDELIDVTNPIFKKQ